MQKELFRARRHLDLWQQANWNAKNRELLIALAVTLLWSAGWGPYAHCQSDDRIRNADSAAVSPANDVHVFRNAENPLLDGIGDPLPEKAVMRLGTERFVHPGSAQELVLSADNRVLLSVGRGIVAWDAVSGKQLWKKESLPFFGHIPGPLYGQRFFDVSADGTKFYSIASGDSVRIWDAMTGDSTVEYFDTHDGPKDPIKPQQLDRMRGPLGLNGTGSISVTSDGDFVLRGNSLGIALFERKQGKRLWERQVKGIVPADQNDRLGFGGAFADGLIGPGNKTIATWNSGDRQKIEILEFETGEVRHSIPVPAAVVRAVFDASGTVLYTTQRDCGVRAYSTKSGEEVWELKPKPDPNGAESYASAIDFTAVGSRLAVGMPIGDKHWIYLLDAKTGELTRILKSNTWKPWGVQFSADGKLLYSTGWDGAIRKWNVEQGKQLPLEDGLHCSGVASISPDGKRIAIVDSAGAVRLIDLATGKETGKIEPGLQAACMNFSPSGRLLAIGGSTDSEVGLKVWNVVGKQLVSAWSERKGASPHASLEEVQFSPDEKLVAAPCFRQNRVLIGEIGAGEDLVECPHLNVYGISFAPDGEVLATAGWDKVVRLWRLPSGKEQAAFPVEGLLAQFNPLANQKDRRMYTVRFSPSGEHLALCHLSGEITFWNIANRDEAKEVSRTALPNRFVFGSIAYSPDGLWIAAGMMDGNVYILDAVDGNLMLQIPAHRSYVNSLRFAADSSTVLTCSNGVSYVWNLTAPELDTPPPLPSGESLEQLWEQLRAEPAIEAGGQAALFTDAFKAIHAFASKKGAVEFLSKRILETDKLLNPKDDRQKKLMMKVAAKDASAEMTQTLQWALIALRGIGSKESLEAMAEIAGRHPNEGLRTMAERLLNP